MTQGDWQKLLSVPPDSLTDEDRDLLCKSIIDHNVEADVDIRHLHTVYQTAKEVLKYKADQVESLVLELDELAAKQGEEEARYTLELNNLRAELVLARKSIGFQQENGGGQREDLQRELEFAELRAEKLHNELQVQEQERLADKRELERLEGQVAMLESERSQLRREVSALREDMRESQKAYKPVDSPSPREDIREKHKKLLESVRQKNKHISRLLNDLEMLEKENAVLHEKLSGIKIEMEEATNNIKHTTGEIMSLQHTKEEQKQHIQQLEQLCEALRNQVDELVQQKQIQESQIDGFERALDARLQEWKELVQEKEKELLDLREKLSHQALHGSFILDDSETSRVALISQTLQKREQQIEELQSQLAEATKDVNESSALIETLRSQSTKTDHSLEQTEVHTLKQQILQAEQQIHFLEEKLQDAQLDAQGKSEDITEMIIKLRRYEAGEYGLPEAVSEIKELQQQLKVRDKHIGELVDTANHLKATCDSFEEQNMALRDQLNLPPDAEVNIDGVRAKKRKDQLLMQVQQQHVDRLEEELVEIRVKNRKLSQQLISLHKQLEVQRDKGQLNTSAEIETKSTIRDHPINPALSKKIRKLQREQHQWESQRQFLIEENEALRQGLHEVSDSIRLQDGRSTVQLESKGLEKVLQALDSRHVSGWYHPAMRLQAEVNTAEGTNAALREQLRHARENEVRSTGELQKSQQRIAELERLLDSRSAEPAPVLQLQDALSDTLAEATVVLSLPADTPASSLELISKLNSHLLQVLNDCEMEKDHVVRLQSLQLELQQELDSLLTQLGNVCHDQVKTQSEWENQKRLYEDQVEALEIKLAEAEGCTVQLRKELEAVTSEDNQAQSVLQRIVALAADKAISDRRASVAVRRAETATEQLKHAKLEWQAAQAFMNKRLEFLLRFKKTSALQISKLEEELEHTVPMQRLQIADRRTLEATAKYSELLRQHEMMLSEMNRKVKLLQEELRLERENKSNLITSIQDAYNRNLKNDEVDELRSQLLALEIAQARDRERASHEEKMVALARSELSQMQERCCQLEREVSILIQSNHELQLREVAAQDSCLFSVPLEKVDELRDQLTSLQQQVSDLQTNREKLQELADIANEQVHAMKHFSENSEVQMESLRQTVCQLQATSDHAATIARLNEDLCALQLSEMAAKNQASILQAEIFHLQGVCERQENTVSDLQQQISQHKMASLQNARMMMDTISELRARFVGSLPATLMHLIADALINECTESRTLWQQLQEEKHKGFLQTVEAEEGSLLRQQTLELQNALQAQHSDIDCQCILESWSAKNTELRLKELKSTRRCEMLEDQLHRTEERLAKQEELLSTLEAHLINMDMNVSSRKKDEVPVVLKGTSPPDTKTQESQTEQFLDVNQLEMRQIKTNELQDYQVDQQSGTIQKVEDKENEVTILKAQILSLMEEVKSLKQQLGRKEEEVATCNNVIIDLRQSAAEREVAQQIKYEKIEKTLSEKKKTMDGEDSPNKLAFKATIDSFQNIINQKEETIGRYQGLLRDVREENARIIMGLQEQVRSLQADLLAQEQAYSILKSSIRKESVGVSGGSITRSVLDSHLTRTHELEDEVALLNTRVASVSAELQSARQEAQRWSNIAQQRLVALEDLGHKLDKQYVMGETWNRLSQEQNTTQISNYTINQELKKKSMSELNLSKAVDRVTRNRAQQVQLQLRAEVIDLRNKVKQMEEQEAISKREIQRLRDQIPIYSRRVRRTHTDESSSKEDELNKKITELMEQIQKQNLCIERTETENKEKLAQRIKSAENIARWDERKKYQSQLEKLKNRLQERMDEIVVLQSKSEKMHVSIHRLEREKAALEHQVKAFRSREIPESAFQQLQEERDSLLIELKELQAKDIAEKAKIEQIEALKKENSALRKTNIALECESLQLKLELEKLQADTPRLQHKMLHLENLIDELHSQNSDPMKRHVVTCAGDPGTPITQGEADQHRTGNHLENLSHHSALSLVKKMQSETTLLKKEKQELQERCQDLSWQLERANALITNLNMRIASGKSNREDVALLESELNHKSQLLSKVKVLLERAAFKERALTDQVTHLEAVIASQSARDR